jgi:hypothetical protein
MFRINLEHQLKIKHKSELVSKLIDRNPQNRILEWPKFAIP